MAALGEANGQGDAAAQALGEQLFEASSDGKEKRVARLLALNAPVNHRETEDQWTPLFIAAAQGHIDVVTLLANRGGDLEARTTGGDTALIWASLGGELEVVQLLVDRKADIEACNQHGTNALMCASMYGHLAVVQYLASKGSSINTTSNKGCDALMDAALNGFADVVLFLISKGGDPRVVHPRFVRYYNKESALNNESALTHFGYYGCYDKSPSHEEQQRVQKQFLAAWKAGIHPDARWLRRCGLVMALAGSKLRPMARDLAAQRQIQATMDLRASLPPIDRKTSKTNWTYLLGAVFGHEGIVRRIAQFVPAGDDD